MEEELEKWILVEDIVDDENEEPLQVEEPQDLLGKLIVRTQHTRPSNAPSANSLMKRGGATGQTLAAEFISAAGA